MDWNKSKECQKAVGKTGILYVIRLDGFTTKKKWVCDIHTVDGKVLRTWYAATTAKALRETVEFFEETVEFLETEFSPVKSA